MGLNRDFRERFHMAKEGLRDLMNTEMMDGVLVNAKFVQCRLKFAVELIEKAIGERNFENVPCGKALR